MISPDTYTELPFLSLCGGVRVGGVGGLWGREGGGVKPPLYLLSPQRDYVRNAGNLTDPRVSRYGSQRSCPLTFWERPSYLKLDTGRPPRRGKPGRTKIHSPTHFQSLTGATLPDHRAFVAKSAAQILSGSHRNSLKTLY